jgi:hypothetical protein
MSRVDSSLSGRTCWFTPYRIGKPAGVIPCARGHTAAGDNLRAEAQIVVVRAGPWAKWNGPCPSQFVLVGDSSGYPLDKHAPPGAVNRIDAVDLERDDRIGGRGNELGPVRGPDENVSVEQGKAYRQHNGKRTDSHRDPAELGFTEQLEALQARQDIHRIAIPSHLFSVTGELP